MNLRKSISVALAQKGENQKQLATKLKWSEAGLSMAMRRNSMPLDRLRMVAEHFGIKVSELIALGEG